MGCIMGEGSNELFLECDANYLMRTDYTNDHSEGQVSVDAGFPEGCGLEI